MATMGMAATMGERVAALPRALTVVTGWALVASVGSLALSVPAVLDGELYGSTRSAIALVGVVAAALVVTGRRVGLDGLQALLAWSLLQVPVYADTPGGNLFRQLFDVPLVATSSTSVNGELTSYSAVGLNVVGIVLAAVVSRQRDAWRRTQRERAERSV